MVSKVPLPQALLAYLHLTLYLAQTNAYTNAIYFYGTSTSTSTCRRTRSRTSSGTRRS